MPESCLDPTLINRKNIYRYPVGVSYGGGGSSWASSATLRGSLWCVGHRRTVAAFANSSWTWVCGIGVMDKSHSLRKLFSRSASCSASSSCSASQVGTSVSVIFGMDVDLQSLQSLPVLDLADEHTWHSVV